MKFTKPLLLSGLLAAVVIGGLVLLGTSQRPPQPAAPAPQPAPPSQPTPQPVPPAPAPAPVATKPYADAKLGFAVDYPASVTPTEDKQDMQMSGYIPICDPDTAVVCFPYPKEQMPGTNFEGAGFSVRVLKDLKTEADCQAVADGEQADGAATVGGVSYKKFAYGDAAMSHQLAGENYRAFHDGTCFQLSTDIFTSTFEVYEPGTIQKFTDDDRSAVQHLLDVMLMSFRFTGN